MKESMKNKNDMANGKNGAPGACPQRTMLPYEPCRRNTVPSVIHEKKRAGFPFQGKPTRFKSTDHIPAEYH